MKLIGICESLTELVLLSQQSQDDFEILMWNLVDYLRGLQKRGNLQEILEIIKEPPLIGNSIQDRYLAAVMESLFIEFQMDVPNWVLYSERIEGIEDFIFINPSERAKPILRKSTTLPPFVKRKLWYGNNAMSRC
jgi:hypothetical protein